MIKFGKTRTVKDPSRGTGKSAGIDFYVPEFDDEFYRDFNLRNTNARSMCFLDSQRKAITVRPHGQVIIPLGIICDFHSEPDSVLLFFNKSGVSWETRISMLGGVVDQDYQGELMAAFHNYTDYVTYINSGMKIIQAIRMPVFYDEIAILPKSELHATITERGAGGYGSTGHQ